MSDFTDLSWECPACHVLVGTNTVHVCPTIRPKIAAPLTGSSSAMAVQIADLQRQLAAAEEREKALIAERDRLVEDGKRLMELIDPVRFEGIAHLLHANCCDEAAVTMNKIAKLVRAAMKRESEEP